MRAYYTSICSTPFINSPKGLIWSGCFSEGGFGCNLLVVFRFLICFLLDGAGLDHPCLLTASGWGLLAPGRSAGGGAWALAWLQWLVRAECTLGGL